MPSVDRPASKHSVYMYKLDLKMLFSFLLKKIIWCS